MKLSTITGVKPDGTIRPMKRDHLPDASKVLSPRQADIAESPGAALAEYARRESEAPPAAATFTPAPSPALAPAISLRILPGEKSLEMQSSAAIAAALAPVGAEIKLTIRW